MLQSYGVTRFRISSRVITGSSFNFIPYTEVEISGNVYTSSLHNKLHISKELLLQSVRSQRSGGSRSSSD